MSEADILKRIKSTVEALETDYNKFKSKKVKAAGQRVRNQLLNTKKMCDQLRKQIVEEMVSMPTKHRIGVSLDCETAKQTTKEDSFDCETTKQTEETEETAKQTTKEEPAEVVKKVRKPRKANKKKNTEETVDLPILPPRRESSEL